MKKLKEDLINTDKIESKEIEELAQENEVKKKATRTRKRKTEEAIDNIEKDERKEEKDVKSAEKAKRTRRTVKKTGENVKESAENLAVGTESIEKRAAAKRSTKKKTSEGSTIKETKTTKSRARGKKNIVSAKEQDEANYSDLATLSRTEANNINDDRSSENSIISSYNTYLFHQGKHYESYKFLGAHLVEENGERGTRFTTWAPNASSVKVVGDFNSWQGDDESELIKVSEVGLWSGFIPKLNTGAAYKYAITSKDGKKVVFKADPYALTSELRPNTASIITEYSKYQWNDENWIEHRNNSNVYESPINIYEVHAGSWKRKEDGSFYSYLELARLLPKYVKEMGYTHVELMPIMEHPLDDSWGYQVTGYYSVTSRFGSADDFRVLVDAFHSEDIGVILDWVPGHFCKDEHGLYKFDGTPTYEYSDPLKQENKGWGAANFDLGKPEVKSFLISNALYWIREFHIDGLRVDAVANMLYLDYDRKQGEWKPNKYGGRENLEAIDFLRDLNKAVFSEVRNVLVIAEESTSWPMVTKPGDIGGLGFNFKWNMGWMNDMLRYVRIDPVYRKYHHNLITFSMMYNYSENFILPISHDEVVHGKKSLIDKMWGDYWNKFAGLRLFISYMLAHPGKKLLFMGSEFGQFIEWRNHEDLEFELIDKFDTHRDTRKFFKDINKFYLENSVLWKYDYDPKGFEWIDANNSTQSIIVFMRKTDDPMESLIYVCNFTPVVYYDFNIGVPYLGEYKEVFNTDSKEYGGSGQIMEETLFSEKIGWHNQKYRLTIKIPPMATLILKPVNIMYDMEENHEEELSGLSFNEAINTAEKNIKNKDKNS